MEKFWSPVPWMLEGAIALELALGKYVEGAVIGLLLVFNAALGYVQEGRAQATLAALKSRLAVTASARRDGAWKILPAADIVVGDIIKLTLGGLVPADARIQSGEILVDQSMLTGESAPVEAGRRRYRLFRRADPSRRSGRRGDRDRRQDEVRANGRACAQPRMS